MGQNGMSHSTLPHQKIYILHMRAATPKNAISGFENTGIWPFNPCIFPEEAFVASETTNRPDPTNPSANTEEANATLTNTDASNVNESIKEYPDINSSSDEDDISLMMLRNLIATKPVKFEKQVASCSKNITAEPIAGCSKDMFAAPIAGCSKDVPKPIADFSKDISFTEFVSCEIEEKISYNDFKSAKAIITSHKDFGSSCSPHDIIPVPQCGQNITEQKPRRNRGKTAVLTSSPYYLELKEKYKATPVKVVAPVKRNVFGGNKKENNPILKKQKKKKVKGDNLDKTQNTDNVQCNMCSGYYHNSKNREVWICCSICEEWSHERCTSYEKKNEKPYTCDICL